jgi:Flp pilus assembly protein TadG
MIRSLTHSEPGTSVVEFALIAPVLIFLLIGLIDIGRYTYVGSLTAHAARAGLQYGARNLITASDAVGVQHAALQDAPNLSLTVTPTYFCSKNGVVVSCTGSGVTYFVEVQATGTFYPLVSYPGIPSQMLIKQTSVMRVSNQ